MNVYSLFSGIGGMDCGLARAGFHHVGLCEKDEWRRSILAARFPGVPIADDVRSVGMVGRDDGPPERRRDRDVAYRDDRRGSTTGVDLLCGGFPCQDLSVAGKRAGLAGSRSGLFHEFMRIADELVRPGGYVLVENVPGLFSSDSGRDFAVVLASLADIGFLDGAWRVLDSRYFGVPQRRRRVFILARRARGQRCAEILLEPESGGGNFAPSGKAGEEVAGTLGGGPAGGGPKPDTDRMTFVAAIQERAECENPDAGPDGAGFRTDGTSYTLEARSVPQTVAYVTHALSSVGADASEDGTGRGTPLCISTLGANDWKGPGHNRDDKMIPVASGVRRLTPTECERLQGVPDGWTLPGADSKRYAGLGDAVTANVAEWIGKRILAFGALILLAFASPASAQTCYERGTSFPIPCPTKTPTGAPTWTPTPTPTMPPSASASPTPTPQSTPTPGTLPPTIAPTATPALTGQCVPGQACYRLALVCIPARIDCPQMTLYVRTAEGMSLTVEPVKP